MIEAQKHTKGLNHVYIRYPEVDPHIMWSLKVGDFAEDFVGYNLDDYQESLSLCELEGDQLFRKHKRRWVDARYHNFIKAHRVQDNQHFLRPQFIAIGRL
jgi:hypothetical protein